MSYAVGDGRKILHLLDFFPSGSKNWEVGTSAQRTEGLTDERQGLYCLHELAVQGGNPCRQELGTLDSQAPGNSGEASDIQGMEELRSGQGD